MHLGIALETANSCATFNASENGISALFSTQTFSVGYTKNMLVSFGFGTSSLAAEAKPGCLFPWRPKRNLDVSLEGNSERRQDLPLP
jgi:hypothetical protein